MGEKTNTITRRECTRCGAVADGSDRLSHRSVPVGYCSENVVVQRTYIAVDALLDDEALWEPAQALQQMWEAEGIEDVDDAPTPWHDLNPNDQDAWRRWAEIAIVVAIHSITEGEADAGD